MQELRGRETEKCEHLCRMGGPREPPLQLCWLGGVGERGQRPRCRQREHSLLTDTDLTVRRYLFSTVPGYSLVRFFNNGVWAKLTAARYDVGPSISFVANYTYGFGDRLGLYA